MGCDGGSIPKRYELVKTRKNPNTTNNNNNNSNNNSNNDIQQLQFCSLSKEPLRQPIVACKLGKLYNKDAIYEYLLDKNNPKYSDAHLICPHIKKPRDVVTLNLTPNPTVGSVVGGNHGNSGLVLTFDGDESKKRVGLFICPITLKEWNGGGLCFVVIWNCGCVLSEQALKNIDTSISNAVISTDTTSTTTTTTTTTKNICLKCGMEYSNNDGGIVTLNPRADELAVLKSRLLLEDSKRNKTKKRKAVLVNEDTNKKTRNNTLNNSTLNTSNNININLNLPKILEAKKTSKAIQSLYQQKGDEDDKNGNWLTKGTFTRYASFN